MTVQDTITPIRPSLLARLSEAKARFVAYRQQSAIYDRTFRELSALSDRELEDIGISRGDLRDVALETARRS